MKRICFSLIFIIVLTLTSFSQVIKLPEPDREGGMPLMQALNERHTSREFSDRELPVELLGNLFWAACGQTFETHRTVPSAHNFQEVKAYSIMKDGVYLYDEKDHSLRKLLDGDFREFTGTQAFVKDAPLVIVMVADLSVMTRADENTRIKYAWADAAFISQNIYLFCASEGLNTGVRALINRETLAEKMSLGENQEIILAQCVGYPK